ncbi:hypothetical protein J5N97_019498 [Dioscorea zingiberensis]|uniref:Protein kinase domain-containing protein n=1 Tax=Dioscorea zingiberensis TaxID=325984 RepID=A0A9D5HCJ2_9LILI|nr:hypothetical protein J5N97_019498 [Dioscorea zingiberensis]
MNPMPILLFLLAIPPLLLSSSQATNQRFSDCAPVPFSCGNLNLSISYPFLVDKRPSYCGYDGFHLTCDYSADPKLIIFIKSQSFQVLDVDYSNNFLTVVDLAVAGQSCPQSYKNTSLDFSLFEYTEFDRNLTLYINCTGSPNSIPTFYEIACSLGAVGGHSYYRLDNSTAIDLFGVCSSIGVVPMNQTVADMLVNSRGGMNLSEAVRAGFTVRWLPGLGWCDDCIISGGLCGYNVSNPQEHTCFCSNGTADGTCLSLLKENDRVKKKVIIGVCAGIGGFLLACALCFLWYRRKRGHQAFSSYTNSLTGHSKSISRKVSEVEVGSPTYPTHFFSYQELLEATDSFNVSKELGDGGYGTVYKGNLRDGRTVAIKRLYDNNNKRVEQYVNEVRILSCLRHQNLVSLYGCTSPQSRELVLVYELVPNGTVADHLHGPRAKEGNLLWPVRMSIAIETADALAYLHAVDPPIIHRDVKTSNILLDKEFHVKVADFGLSRLFPIDATHVSTAPQGTPGYLDPDYYQCYQLTDKSDVYSFGVVLVELISSKPAVDITRDRNEINLASMAIHKIQNCELEQLVDPSLGYHSDVKVKTMITLVAELAFRCLQGEKEMRPSIKEVLEILRGIENHDTGHQDLQPSVPFSPDSVFGKWTSRTTTPNNSG